jgi:hypothetical protein
MIVYHGQRQRYTSRGYLKPLHAVGISAARICWQLRDCKLRACRYHGGELIDTTQCKKIIFNLFAYRLTRGIGLWQCRRSIRLSAMRELPHLISPIFCRGQCSLLFNGNTVLQVLIWRMNMTRVGTLGSCIGTFLSSKCIPCVLKVDRMAYVLS